MEPKAVDFTPAPSDGEWFQRRAVPVVGPGPAPYAIRDGAISGGRK